MEVESTLTQTLNSNKKPNKLRSIRFPRLSFLKKTSSKKSSKSRFSCLSIDTSSDNLSPEQLSPVKMPDLSPNYMKVTTSYDAKKGSTSQVKLSVCTFLILAFDQTVPVSNPSKIYYFWRI